MKSKKIYIHGMHCPSCEKLLTDEFGALAGVKEVKVDRKTAAAEIFYENGEPDFAAIKKTAEKFGYQAFETDSRKPGRPVSQWGKIDWTEWLKAGLILIALFFAYRIFKNLGWLNIININSEQLNYGVSFLIGLVASVSTCLAIVGSVVIAFAEKYKTDGGGFWAGAVKPNLQFHSGRLAAFFLLGGALGVIGGEINISGNFISIFTIIIAIVLGWLGLNILGILPAISALGIRIPGKLTNKWSKLKQSNHRSAPFLLGALSFFLPCGFTQSMQIFALTSGSFWTGGWMLFIFALGTLPVLLVLGVTASWTKNKMTVFQKVAGVLVVIFAIWTLQSGLALRGMKANILTTANKQPEINTEQSAAVNNNQNANANKQEQTVNMKLDYNGYAPDILKIKKGAPVKWVIQVDQMSGCTDNIVIPALDISQDLKLGENIIKFTAPNKSGTLNFSCWMGMVRGKFIVE